MLRLLKHSMLLLMLYASMLCATVLLKGKVYDEKKNTVKNLSLRLSSIGTVVTTNSGEFIAELPDDVQYVEIEITGNGYTLLYPLDEKIPVPADRNYISKIVVAKSVEQVKNADEAAKKYTRLESLLKDVGVAQDELKQLISEYIQKESTESSINKEAIKDAIFKEKREESYSKISEVISRYILKSKTLKDGFRLVSELAFRNENAVKELVSFIENYNTVFNELNNNKYSFESDIALYWNDTTLSAGLFNLINYAVDNVHKPYILKLNEDIVNINKIRLAEVGNGERENLEKQTTDDIKQIVSGLDESLPVFEKDTDKFLTSLNPVNYERE